MPPVATLAQDVPPQRAGHPAPADLEAQRAGLAAAVSSGMWRTDPAAEEVSHGGVRCLHFHPPGASRGTVIHLHGGGFRIGCPEQIGPFAAELARRCQVDVICPAYRLAPEHPFPAGLVDAWSVAANLIAADVTRLIISGDSAGGGLAAGLAALLVRASPRPAGLVLLSPWLDLAATNSSFQTNAATDPLFSQSAANAAAALYLQGMTPQHPLASPLHGPVADFPPTLINVGTGEVLADDARLLHDRLQAAAVPVRLQQLAGMDHVAVTRGAELPGAAETFDAIADFLAQILSPV